MIFLFYLSAYALTIAVASTSTTVALLPFLSARCAAQLGRSLMQHRVAARLLFGPKPVSLAREVDPSVPEGTFSAEAQRHKRLHLQTMTCLEKKGGGVKAFQWKGCGMKHEDDPSSRR